MAEVSTGDEPDVLIVRLRRRPFLWRIVLAFFALPVLGLAATASALAWPDIFLAGRDPTIAKLVIGAMIVGSPIMLVSGALLLRVASGERNAILTPSGGRVLTMSGRREFSWSAARAIETRHTRQGACIGVVHGKSDWRDWILPIHTAYIYVEPVTDVSESSLLAFIAKFRPDLTPSEYWLTKLLKG